jgi:hypothetical protein
MSDLDRQFERGLAIGTMARSIGRALCLCAALPLIACQHSPPYLPSRPPGEMFPRASSPPPACPGQYRTTIEDFNGSIFLGCWGTKPASEEFASDTQPR